jgi:acyl-CoA dehydrogenase
MDFTVPEEVEMQRETLRRFVTEEVIPLEQANDLSWDVAPPKELRKQVRLKSRALGLYGVDMPEEVGGGGMPLATRCLLEIEANFHDTVFFDDLLGGVGGPTRVLLACDDGQRERYLYPVVEGETTTRFALSEPDAGSDATALATRAERRDEVFVLNGIKNIVTNGAQADFALVFAVTDKSLAPRGGGITCFLVDKSAPGFSVSREHNCMCFRGFQAELAFRTARVAQIDAQ